MVDLAEIPTAQELPDIDPDGHGPGRPGPEGGGESAALASDVVLTVDGDGAADRGCDGGSEIATRGGRRPSCG